MNDMRCFFSLLPRQVVWVSPKETVISLEDRRMINDMRISVERPFLRDWNLHIRNVSITDAGLFMCQLNTAPVTSKQVNLLVNGQYRGGVWGGGDVGRVGR